MGEQASQAGKFDASRAAEYAEQSRVALAGYDACHELTACILSAALGRRERARVLVAGAGGTGMEIVTIGGLKPGWEFVAVDPSKPMLDLAASGIETAGYGARTQTVLGTVEDLPPEQAFDAATLIGVLHHVRGEEEKSKLLGSIAMRLRPGAPFVLAGNHHAYESRPLLLAAWAERWRMGGAGEEEVTARHGKILHAAEPPADEETIYALLAGAGFERPERFFSSLFWGAWISFRR